MEQRFTFKRAERLKSRKLIEQTFAEGKSKIAYPIRAVWLLRDAEQQTQAAFAVPKRRIKKAVDRNRIKRIIREAYRLNKHLLYEQLDNKEQSAAIIFHYVANEELPHDKIEASIRKLLKHIPNSSKIDTA